MWDGIPAAKASRYGRFPTPLPRPLTTEGNALNPWNYPDLWPHHVSATLFAAVRMATVLFLGAPPDQVKPSPSTLVQPRMHLRLGLRRFRHLLRSVAFHAHDRGDMPASWSGVVDVCASQTLPSPCSRLYVRLPPVRSVLHQERLLRRSETFCGCQNRPMCCVVPNLVDQV